MELDFHQAFVFGALHEGNFLRRLAHARMRGDVFGVDQAHTRHRLGDAVADKKCSAFIHGQDGGRGRNGGHAHACQHLGAQGVGAIVFVPGVHLARQDHVLLQGAHFKPRGDKL